MTSKTLLSFDIKTYNNFAAIVRVTAVTVAVAAKAAATEKTTRSVYTLPLIYTMLVNSKQYYCC